MTNAKTVFMFAGQGSQHFEMARELFDQDPVFRECMLKLDGVARELSGNSVVDTLYFAGHSKGAPFARTLLTHPAILMIEYALAQSLMRSGVVPDITLGASLGSFAAATIAGLITIEDALATVIGQAKVLEEHCKPGGMLAVIAAPTLYEEDFLAANAEMAGVNFASHFVVAARQENFMLLEAGLRKREAAYQRLPVSFAFHSRWIEEARVPFEAFTRSIRRKPSQLAYMCCSDAAIVADLPEDYFWRVVRRPIRFREAIAKLEAAGSYRYIDVGPSSTLATFLKYGLSKQSRSTVHPILTPYGQDRKNLAAVLSATRH